MGWSRTFDRLLTKWGTLNRQQVTLSHEANTAIVAIIRVACNTMTEVLSKSQKIIGPWNGLATNSIDQDNLWKMDLR